MMKNYRELTQTEFSKTVERIGHKAKELQEDIHNLAMYALYHLNAHTNTVPANELLEALPESQRVQALKHWFTTFGACNVTKDGVTFNKKKEGVRGEKLESNLDHAAKTPFWVLTKEQVELKPYKFGIEELEKTLARARDSVSKVGDKYASVDIDIEMMEAITKTIADLRKSRTELAAIDRVRAESVARQAAAFEPAPF